MVKKIYVASTYATDVILDDKDKVVSKQLGGPLYFIKRVLNESNIPSELFTGDKAEVKIRVSNGLELGNVITQLTKHNTSELGMPDWLLISTVLDEWVIDNEPIPAKLFIDIQGYVRNKKTYGGKHTWSPPDRLIGNIFCVKGTEEEINYLEPNFINLQKNKILIITKGSKGADAYVKGELYSFQPGKVVALKNTIGAGDTFFAYFVVNVFKGIDILKSVQLAIDSTTNFLSIKVKQDTL